MWGCYSCWAAGEWGGILAATTTVAWFIDYWQAVEIIDTSTV